MHGSQMIKPQGYVLSCFGHIWLFATLWTLDRQAPLSIGFSRQEYWSGLPWPPPGDLPHPGIKFTSPLSPALANRFFITSASWGAPGPPEKQHLFTAFSWNMLQTHRCCPVQPSVKSNVEPIMNTVSGIREMLQTTSNSSACVPLCPCGD